jgi:hypothetical protein
MPSEVTVRVHAREKCERQTREKREPADAIFFEVLSAEGGRAVRDGVVVLH